MTLLQVTMHKHVSNFILLIAPATTLVELRAGTDRPMFDKVEQSVGAEPHRVNSANRASQPGQILFQVRIVI